MAYLGNYMQGLFNKNQSDVNKNVGLGETKSPIGTALPTATTPGMPAQTKAATTSTAGQILKANPNVNYESRTAGQVQDVANIGAKADKGITQNLTDYNDKIITPMLTPYKVPTNIDYSTGTGREQAQGYLNSAGQAVNVPAFAQTATYNAGQINDPALRSNISGNYSTGMKGLDNALFGNSNAIPRLGIENRNQQQNFDIKSGFAGNLGKEIAGRVPAAQKTLNDALISQMTSAYTGKLDSEAAEGKKQTDANLAAGKTVTGMINPQTSLGETTTTDDRAMLDWLGSRIGKNTDYGNATKWNEPVVAPITEPIAPPTTPTKPGDINGPLGGSPIAGSPMRNPVVPQTGNTGKNTGIVPTMNPAKIPTIQSGTDTRAPNATPSTTLGGTIKNIPNVLKSTTKDKIKSILSGGLF